MKRKTALLGTALMLFCSALRAQVSFTNSTGTYNQLTGATQLLKDSVWDELDYNTVPTDMIIPLGFKIKYNGVEHDTLYLYDANIIGDNKKVIFGNGLDMVDRGYAENKSKSPIYIKREGTLPNRIVKIEFRNAGFYDEFDANGTLDDSLTLQYWFYENGNKFEFHAGPSSLSGKFPDYLDFVTVGILPQDDAPLAALQGASTSPELTSDIATLAGLDDFPASGRIYTFAMDPNYTGVSKVSTEDSRVYYSNQVICAKSNDIKGLRIFAVNGKEVLRANFSNNQINVSQLPTGTYVAIYKGGVLKFIKE